MPRGGIIVSYGSTSGRGFAPLVGASVTAVLNGSGGVVSVGIGSTDIRGSGYYGNVSIGITDPNHTEHSSKYYCNSWCWRNFNIYSSFFWVWIH